jgi:20S proteasome subunit alpha 3
MEAISHAGTVLAVLSKEGIAIAAEKVCLLTPSRPTQADTVQKVTGKLLDLSLPGGSEAGGEGVEAWMGGGGEKIFLLNKWVMSSEHN